ncbi:2-keto-4-pentenoate hydratase [Bradyrhizobium tropiciagri]|uniref:2-keto-4-pentenoate hydratase n=1 Tax=Bradyrhizobium tropiciagri TaxID=312253 RepID=UPI0020139325|nr:fumarylacetoacetate hydrolase family protein [Bradyrhizobium tropiciagri]
MNQSVLKVADLLTNAEADRKQISPIVSQLGQGNVEAAYQVQAELTRRGIGAGRRLVGRKVGLTSVAVQQQLGVGEPDFGALFADMEIEHLGSIKIEELIQPRIEAEVALVLDRDLDQADTTAAELTRAIAFVAPALEIVDSRIADWKISIVDTIADNGSSARYALGDTFRRITDVDLATCGMSMTRNGEIVSVGAGAACLGHPLKAALWLVRKLASAGAPLRAGDVILTGALGPMVSVTKGETYEAHILGLGSVQVRFG